jgi:hypothetical protein
VAASAHNAQNVVFEPVHGLLRDIGRRAAGVGYAVEPELANGALAAGRARSATRARRQKAAMRARHACTTAAGLSPVAPARSQLLLEQLALAVKL